MASKSGGSVDDVRFRGVMDANQAMALLDTVHHWHATRVNREAVGHGVQVQITHGGKRVRVQRRSFVEAVNAAFTKLKQAKGEPPASKPTGGRKGLRLAEYP